MTYDKRWYQQEAISRAVEHITKKEGSPLLALPTGTGKSVIIAEVIRGLISRYPRMRIAMLTHSKELVRQNAERLMSVFPDVDLGVFSAGLGVKEDTNQVIYASVQSVASAVKSGKNGFGVRHLVIVDEAHMIAPGDATNYQIVFEEWRKAYPTMKILGLTATPYRMRGGMLTEGDGAMFTDLAYDVTSVRDFTRLIEEGYLSPLIAYKTDDEIDITGVRMLAGDFNQKQIGEAISREGLLENACREICEKGADRRAWLIFTSGVENSEKVETIMKNMGVEAVAVHSKRSKEDNEEAIEKFRSGEVRCLINADMLTTGFDVPQIDLIGMLRPTASAGLWVQMLGRGTRPCDGKDNCLVLDFAGNTARLGPINDPVLPSSGTRRGQGGTPVMKACPVCSVYLSMSVMRCPSCDHVFETREKLEREASRLSLMKTGDENKIEVWKPLEMRLSEHKKRGKPSSIKVEYVCAQRTVTRYIPWEHGGRAKYVADGWFSKRFKGERPEKVSEIMKLVRGGINIRMPDLIEVDVEHRYKGRLSPVVTREIFNA